MTKYRQAYLEMVEQNQELFTQFREIHDGYIQDRKTWSKQFHEVGGRVIAIMRDQEQKLCASMERGKHSMFSQKLSEKFWSEIRKNYSHIELVGVKSNFD
jgi:hypothetical protein